MKTKFFLVMLFYAGLLSAAPIKLTITNPNPDRLENAPVVVRLSNYSKIPVKQRSKLAVFLNGKQISSQIDDLDRDGTPDELVFLLDLQGGESRQVTLNTIPDSKRIKFPAEVYTDMIVKGKDGTRKFVKEASSDKNDMYGVMHHHGVAFESALIAYRIYFDNKSTIDLYGKRKQQLELAQTGWYPNDEQTAAGFGNDVLRVFSSVGVGSVKGWDGKTALHVEKFDKRTQRIVATGNLRTVVEIQVDGWQYEGKKLNTVVRYIQYARHRDVECQVTASDNIENLATGVQTIQRGSLLQTDRGLLGSWGRDYPESDTTKYKMETVGLGVYVPVPYAGKQVSEGINNLILMPYKKGDTLRFYLTAAYAKEEKNPYTTAEDFFAYLQKWSKNLSPVIVK